MRALTRALPFILFLAVVACATQSSKKEGEPLRIGWIGPLTGDSAVLGVDNAAAAQMAVDEINAGGGIAGKPLELLIEDDRYVAGDAISAYEKLVHAEGVRILLMETYSGVLAVAERAARDGVTVIDTLDCNDVIVKPGPHMFCLGIESESLARQLAVRATSKGYKKPGILYFNSDAFMPYVKDVFVEEYKGKGEAVAEGYAAQTSDFRTVLYRMKNQGIDALVFLGYDELGGAMSQAREMGLQVPFLAPDTMSSAGWQELAGDSAEGTVLTAWKADSGRPQVQSFLKEFSRRRNREPFSEAFTYPAYDAVMAIASALRGGTTLLHIGNFEGVTGPIVFAPDGSMRIRESLHLWKGGKAVPLPE